MTSLLCNYWISVGRAAVMASVDGRLPWLSLGGARTELESVSSLSLLHSIYGSQVSQVLLASEDSDPSFFNPRRAQEGPVATRHSARPKSSPAICRFERDKRRHTSLQPASAAGQKRQLRARPATARTHIGGGAGRPRSALRCVSSSEEAESYSRPNVHETKPVTLTRVPEYVNFWQGKPLSKRECAIPVHSRTAWKRPKSDYGSRITVPTNGNALATVMEGVDGDQLTNSTSKDHSAAEKTVVEDGVSRVNGHALRGKGGSNGNPVTDGDGGAGRRPAAGMSMWARRSQLRMRVNTSNPANDSSHNSDDFFHKDKHAHSSWLEDSGLEMRSTRFELPMDLTLLEQMSPLQYLRTHCIISNLHMSLCSKVFTRLDKDRDARLSKQEVELAMQEVLHGRLSQDQAQYLLMLVLFQPDTLADLHLFAALCCVAERVFSIHLLPTMTGKEVIECVDFEALEWKLRGCTIGQSLHKLFTHL